MRRAWLGVLVALAVIAGACGDSDGESTPTTAAASDDGGGGDGGDDTTTTAAPSTSEAPSGDADSDFCRQAADVQSTFDELGNIAALSPDGIRDIFERGTTALNDIRDVAPADISDDIDLTADGFTQAQAAFADAGYNVLELDFDDPRLAVLDSAEYEAAGDRIEVYVEEVCGVVPAGGDTAPEDVDTDSPIVRAMADELEARGLSSDQAECVAVQLASGGLDVDSPEIIGVFDECGVSAGDIDDADPGGGAAIGGLTDTFVQLGFTQEEAQCLTDQFASENLGDLEAIAEDPAAILQFVEACDISLSRLAEIGG